MMEKTDETDRKRAAQRMDIYARKQAGETFRAIAKRYGISSTRVAQIYNKMLELKRQQEVDPLYGLSKRVKNVCSNLGLKNRQDIEQAVGAEELESKKTKNYGHKSHDEVLKWLGHTAKRVKGRRVTCPFCHKAFSVPNSLKKEQKCGQ